MKAKTIAQAAAVLTIGWAVTATAGAISDTRLEVRTFENIPYISGGIGSEERETLRAMTHGDNLQLSFALADGKYLGGAEVTIKDNMGKEVLEAATDGPLFFAKLRCGKLHRPGYDHGTDACAQREHSAKGTGANLFYLERR